MPSSPETLSRQQAPARIPLTLVGQAERESACNNNCNQGRMCDCVPDVETPREPMTDSDRMWLGVLLGVSALASCGLVAWILTSAGVL